jgi:hypothetical protein
MAKSWHKLTSRFSACYYQNGRTDVRRDDTGDIVVTYSPSLQSDLRRGKIDAALTYLFGKEYHERKPDHGEKDIRAIRGNS